MGITISLAMVIQARLTWGLLLGVATCLSHTGHEQAKHDVAGYLHNADPLQLPEGDDTCGQAGDEHWNSPSEFHWEPEGGRSSTIVTLKLHGHNSASGTVKMWCCKGHRLAAPKNHAYAHHHEYSKECGKSYMGQPVETGQRNGKYGTYVKNICHSDCAPGHCMGPSTNSESSTKYACTKCPLDAGFLMSAPKKCRLMKWGIPRGYCKKFNDRRAVDAGSNCDDVCLDRKGGYFAEPEKAGQDVVCSRACQVTSDVIIDAISYKRSSPGKNLHHKKNLKFSHEENGRSLVHCNLEKIVSCSGKACSTKKKVGCYGITPQGIIAKPDHEQQAECKNHPNACKFVALMR